MGKIILGVIMILVGAAGLMMTLCGLYFLPSYGIGLIGIVPGLFTLWIAKKIYGSIRGTQKDDAPQ